MFLELKFFTVTHKSQSQSNSEAVFTVIILLYLLTLFNFAFQWLYVYSGFINQGINCWIIWKGFTNAGNTIARLGSGVVAGICTILADFTLV